MDPLKVKQLPETGNDTGFFLPDYKNRQKQKILSVFSRSDLKIHRFGLTIYSYFFKPKITRKIMKLYNSLKRMVPACMTGLLAAALLAGCQQELPAPGNDAEEFAGTLKSAQITNLMVLTKSETLPAGFEEQLAAFGEIVSTTPEIGMVVINPKNGKVQAQIAKLKEVQAVVPDIEIKLIDPRESVEATPDHIGSDETLATNGTCGPSMRHRHGMQALPVQVPGCLSSTAGSMPTIRTWHPTSIQTYVTRL